MAFLDISLNLNRNMIVYPGDAGYEEYPYLTHESDGLYITRILMETHTGTHFDAPFHMIKTGERADRVPLEHFIGPCTVVEVDSPEIRPDDVPPVHADRLLFKTPNSFKYDTFDPEFTALSLEAARLLVGRGIKLLGIDYLSIEKYGNREFPVHKEILSSGAVILEGLDLSGVEPGEYELIALPLKISADGSPVRAILRTL